jgi:sec-independent protein translocase protein TatA
MGGMSLWHWVIVALVILVLFGRGKISEMMGDFGKGVSSFKKGLAEAEAEGKPAAQIPPPTPAPVSAPAEAARTPEEEAAAKRDPGG